jgi:hypothetical protein
MSGITLEHVFHMPAAELLLVNPAMLMELLMQAERLRFQAHILCLGLRGALSNQINQNKGDTHD